MDIAAEERDGGIVLRVLGDRIDAAAATRFRDGVCELAGKGDGQVTVDLSEVTFIDSSGLGAIVSAMKLLGRTRRFALVNLTPNVDRVMRLTRLDTVIPILAGPSGGEVRDAV